MSDGRVADPSEKNCGSPAYLLGELFFITNSHPHSIDPLFSYIFSLESYFICVSSTLSLLVSEIEVKLLLFSEFFPFLSKQNVPSMGHLHESRGLQNPKKDTLSFSFLTKHRVESLSFQVCGSLRKIYQKT